MSHVFIGNFGKANWAWPICLEKSVLTVTDDVRIHSYWQSGDRETYIRKTKEFLKRTNGEDVTTQIASRWYNLNTILAETAGDLWIHREKDYLWWTTSLDSPLDKELIEEANRYGESREVFLLYKACAKWSDEDKVGRKLLWNSFHSKAKDFLFTESTFQKLSDNNADYARALIAGDDLSKWHEQDDWKKKTKQSKRGVVTTYNSRQRTSVRMVDTALNTVSQSGSIALTQKKLKESGFKNKAEFEKYVDDLLMEQGQECALTNIPMILDDEAGNTEFLCSLDRIDSNGHYDRDNLQIVCKFVNRWKSNSDDNKFRELIAKIRAS